MFEMFLMARQLFAPSLAICKVLICISEILQKKEHYRQSIHAAPEFSLANLIQIIRKRRTAKILNKMH